jgi:DNA-3-methyladenine glycosylase
MFAGSVHDVARALVGATLVHDGVGGTIVEVEAYAADDPASHSYRGQTRRNAAMFRAPGCAYVYRSYGLHWCFNIVCEPVGVGAAVLVRALAPTVGIERMQERRGVEAAALLCSGPGRLTQALGITGAHDGAPLAEPPFELVARSGPEPVIEQLPRIGISVATDESWRYVLRGTRFSSRPRRRHAP